MYNLTPFLLYVLTLSDFKLRGNKTIMAYGIIIWIHYQRTNKKTKINTMVPGIDSISEVSFSLN